jgi:hypothetical protein
MPLVVLTVMFAEGAVVVVVSADDVNSVSRMNKRILFFVLLKRQRLSLKIYLDMMH